MSDCHVAQTGVTTTSTDAQAELAEFVSWQAEELAAPPSHWETETLAAVLMLPRVQVARPPEAKLLADGMVRNACHPNCASLEERYPDRIRHVSGWLIGSHMLVLHSVIKVGDRWLCVTPQTAPSPSSFRFIPDDHIKWMFEDGEMVPLRGGTKVPNALRKYPEHHIRMRDRLLELVASGATVLDARAAVDATLGNDLRKMAPI